jgi:hypothetical protein
MIKCDLKQSHHKPKWMGIFLLDQGRHMFDQLRDLNLQLGVQRRVGGTLWDGLCSLVYLSSNHTRWILSDSHIILWLLSSHFQVHRACIRHCYANVVSKHAVKSILPIQSSTDHPSKARHACCGSWSAPDLIKEASPTLLWKKETNATLPQEILHQSSICIGLYIAWWCYFSCGLWLWSVWPYASFAGSFCAPNIPCARLIFSF